MQVAGAEMLVMETVRRLAARIKPTIFCLDAVGALGEQLQAEGVEVVCLGRRPGRDWRVAWRLAREMHTAIHRGCPRPPVHAVLLRGSGQAAIVSPAAAPDFHRAWAAFSRMSSRVSGDSPTALCCTISPTPSTPAVPSAPTACTASTVSRPRRVEVIENGIDLSRYGPAADRDALRRRLGLDPGRRYVAMVARFHPIKDHAMLLHAFAKAAPVRPDVDLLLVGDGPLRGELESLVERLGVQNRVRFLGVRSDVPDILRAVDVFALTSVSEAASLTLLEAMASRLPVVVTAVGGNPEIVRDGVEGCSCRAGTPTRPRPPSSAFSTTLPRAAADGRGGPRRVEERYQLSRTIDAYGRLYQRLAGRGREKTWPTRPMTRPPRRRAPPRRPGRGSGSSRRPDWRLSSPSFRSCCGTGCGRC